MSRLIRDTDILDRLESWRDSLDKRDLMQLTIDSILDTVENIVCDIEDGCDVDAVLRELRAERDRSMELYRECGNYDLVREASTFGKAIEIVRGGRNE